MKKTSVVKSVQGSGNYEFNGKTYYRFDYEMEDGTVMQGSHLSRENALQPGDPCEYEVKRDHPTYGKSGSVSKPKEAYSGGGGGKHDLTGIKVGHALNCASALLAAEWKDIPVAQQAPRLKEIAHMVYTISDEMNQEIERYNAQQ